uniref:Ig-like domain-containing protein n=1 Tax=Poecilia formosa TaxID=48698 RepID=A0A087XWR4_POEFO
DKPRPTVRADKRLIPVGGNVTLTCSVDNPTEWKYYWFRHTGNISEVQTVDEGKSENVISISQGGVYYCQGGRGSPVFFTEESHRINIEKRVSNMASVSLRPDWPVIYSGETITVRCEISGGRNNEWVYEWSKPISDTLPTNEYRIVDASESSSGNYRCLGRNKQDLYSSTEWSDITTVTVSEQRPKAQIIPDRDSAGGTVTLTCSVKPSSSSSSSWTYYWYRVEIASKPVELKSDTNGELVTSENGLYFCRAGRGRPVYYTESSQSVTVDIPDKQRPVVTQQPNWSTMYYHREIILRCEIQGQPTDWVFEWISSSGDAPSTQNDILSLDYSFSKYYWCRGRRKSDPHDVTWWSAPFTSRYASYPHPAASLSVSPDREQHFTSESVTLNCGGNSAEWRVMKFSVTGHLIYLRICWAMTGSLCTINRTHSDKSVYWCESKSGEFSAAVNLTVHNEDLLLVSPVHPVTEGASVTLSCRLRGENKLSDVIFYHNDKLIQNDSRGELKISAVSQSDEGFYKCEHSGNVSPQSWMGVKVLPRPEHPSFPVLLVAGLGGLSGKILIILLILLSHCRYLKGDSFL